MAKIHKFISTAIVPVEGLGERQIRVLANTADEDRLNDIVDPPGCFWRGKTVPVLVDHDAAVESLVGQATPEITEDGVSALIEFLPLGVSSKADDACAKAKAGVLNSVSVGFDPIEWEPIKGGGIHYTKWELLEISLVVVPCNPAATVVARSIELEPAPEAAEESAATLDSEDGDVDALVVHCQAIADILKAGRVLSGDNEDALTVARDLIDGVLAQLAPDDPEDEPAEATEQGEVQKSVPEDEPIEQPQFISDLELRRRRATLARLKAVA